MPRKAPSEVIEQRFSLSNFERTEFKQTLDALQRNQNLLSVGNGIKSAALVGVAGAAGLVAWALWYYLGQIKSPVAAIEDLLGISEMKTVIKQGMENKADTYENRIEVIESEVNRLIAKMQMIIEDPEATPTQKQMAAAEIPKIRKQGKAAIRNMIAAYKDDAEKVEELRAKIAWKLWPLGQDIAP